MRRFDALVWFFLSLFCVESFSMEEGGRVKKLDLAEASSILAEVVNKGWLVDSLTGRAQETVLRNPNEDESDIGMFALPSRVKCEMIIADVSDFRFGLRRHVLSNKFSVLHEVGHCAHRLASRQFETTKASKCENAAISDEMELLDWAGKNVRVMRERYADVFALLSLRSLGEDVEKVVEFADLLVSHRDLMSSMEMDQDEYDTSPAIRLAIERLRSALPLLDVKEEALSLSSASMISRFRTVGIAFLPASYASMTVRLALKSHDSMVDSGLEKRLSLNIAAAVKKSRAKLLSGKGVGDLMDENIDIFVKAASSLGCSQVQP